MIANKNGIPIAVKNNRIQSGKPFRAVANPHKRYVTLFRKEEFVPVWLVMPLINKEIKQLKIEGWRVTDVWEVKS